jgi:hypothetical protein
MTRSLIAAILCAALGAWYAWGLGADSRWREQECRRVQAEVVVANAEALAVATKAHSTIETWLCTMRGGVCR